MGTWFQWLDNGAPICKAVTPPTAYELALEAYIANQVCPAEVWDIVNNLLLHRTEHRLETFNSAFNEIDHAE